MNTRSLVQSLLVASLVVLTAATSRTAHAQASYSVVDLTPSGLGFAQMISNGQVFGYTVSAPYNSVAHAAKWNGSTLEDLHPAFLDDAGSGIAGRSAIVGGNSTTQVGYGVGVGTSGRTAPMLWHGSAASAEMLSLPFDIWSGTAYSTDGVQAVGTLNELDFDVTTPVPGDGHAVVWNVASGVPTDLGKNGNGAVATAVFGGKQYGYVFRSNGAEATAWSGSRQTEVSMHPAFFVASQIVAADGPYQVGNGIVETRLGGERNRNRGGRVRNSHAVVWSGTAASAIDLHVDRFAHSYALGIQGSFVVGYGYQPATTTAPLAYNAFLWNLGGGVTNLHRYLPSNFKTSFAYAVAQDGTAAGVAVDEAGVRHTLLWVPTN